MATTDIGIDLGTAKYRHYFRENRGVVLREPSAIAYHLRTKEVLAVGDGCL